VTGTIFVSDGEMTEVVHNATATTIEHTAAPERSRRPVFVMGCHRSGTNLLYDTLLSAGGFAVYRGYLPIYKLYIPRFGHPRNPANRKKIVETFLRSKGFARTNLEAGYLSARLLENAKSGGDFVRVVMNEVAQHQGMGRWAVYDPDSVLHVLRIKADIPDALFIHIIRDGRDIAVSLKKMGEFRPFPWSSKARGLLETALYWQWMVRTGREYGSRIPGDYMEVHYEKLVTEPREALAALSQFLGQDLDYDRIQNAGLGRLSQSNSSFLDEGATARTQTVNRWKERLSGQEIAGIEGLVGSCLEESGYQLTTTAEQRRPSLSSKLMAAAYPHFLGTKLWLKVHTPVGRFANLSALELSEPAGE
jgi:LPS sulfotransferase NodH